MDIPASITQLASNPEDDQDTVLKKSTLVSTSLMIVVSALIWGFICILAGKPLAGTIPLSYSFLSALSLIWLTRGNFRFITWLVNSNSTVFPYLILLAELAVGIGLVFGFLTPLINVNKGRTGRF